MEENQNPAPSIMSISLKYGLILALVSIATFALKVALGKNPFESDWTGWVSLLIGIGIVVLAHNNFKNDGDGFMSYGQGFAIAALATLISGIIGLVFNLFYINFIDTNVMDDLYRITEEKMQEQGRSDQEIQIAIEWTKKLFWVIYVVMMCIISVLYGLVVPIFTQKKNPEPAI